VHVATQLATQFTTVVSVFPDAFAEVAVPAERVKLIEPPSDEPYGAP
jgi:hypothetical protein